MQLQYLFNLLPFYLLYGSPVNPPQTANKAQNRVLNSEMDAFIRRVLVDWNSPGGVAVALVRRDAQGAWDVETKGYGVATANGSKVNEQTLFAIGSNSKLFNVLATGLLINNETLSPRLSWDSKIAAIVPIWELVDPVASREATIIDVMSHRTGLPRHDFMYKSSDSVPSIIQRLKYLRPSAGFRDVWQYNNNMYTLLSHLPTRLLPSHPPFARYVKQHIFEPLGLASTTYSYERAAASGHLADGMTRQGVNASEDPFGNGTAVRALPFWSTAGGEDGNALSGAGGVISNSVDMATWLQVLLLNGIKPGTNDSVLPVDALEKAATGISVQSGTAQFPELSPVVYGGGQARSTYRGHELIEHGGSVPGFNTQITRLPHDNIGVAVLTNDHIFGGLIAEVVKGRVLDAALGLDALDWSSRLRARAASPPPPATPRPADPPLPSLGLTALAGTYHNPGYGEVELCLVSPPSLIDVAAASPACRALAADAPRILPGAVAPDVPTFLARWGSPLASHVRLAHFSGEVFNVSGVTSMPTGDASAPYWTFGGDGATGMVAEVDVEGGHVGIGFTGIWGAGEGVAPAKGETVRGRAEMWMEKLNVV